VHVLQVGEEEEGGGGREVQSGRRGEVRGAMLPTMFSRRVDGTPWLVGSEGLPVGCQCLRFR
jgi:hypothetical protein